MFGTAVRTCKQSILSVERDRPDQSLDGVVVELDAAIVDEAGQPLPARQRVADGLGKFALLTDQTEFCAQPRFKGIDQRPAFLLAIEAALVSVTTAEIFLDGIERGETFERFAGDGRRTGDRELIEVAAYVRPAERKADVATICQLAVAGIAIDLQDALEAVQMDDRPLRFAIGCVDIGHARWIQPAPWPVVSCIGPQLTSLGAAPARIEHGRCGLVRKQRGQFL